MLHEFAGEPGERVTFLDELNNFAPVSDVHMWLCPAWWQEAFPHGGPTWEEFSASDVRCMTTSAGIMLQLLPSPEDPQHKGKMTVIQKVRSRLSELVLINSYLCPV